MKLTRLLCIMALASTLVACGGSDNDPDASTGGTGGDAGPDAMTDGGAGACLDTADRDIVENMRTENANKAVGCGTMCITQGLAFMFDDYQVCVASCFQDTGNTNHIAVSDACNVCIAANTRCSSEHCVITNNDGTPVLDGQCTPASLYAGTDDPYEGGAGTPNCVACQTTNNCVADFNACIGFDLP